MLTIMSNIFIQVKNNSHVFLFGDRLIPWNEGLLNIWLLALHKTGKEGCGPLLLIIYQKKWFQVLGP